MKQVLAALLIVIFFIFFNLAARGQNLPFPEKKYSILGTERDKVFEEYDSTGTKNPAEEENYFVPLSSETSSEYQLNIPTTTAQIEAGSDLIDYMASKNFFSYTKEQWNEMRRKKEKGLRPGEEEPAVSTVPVSIRQQLPPGLAVELPYESQLSISGRKLIGSSLKSTIYDQPEEGKRVNSTSFSMEQQLQVRIKGTVGRKVNVNVDFDDTTSDKRDISVVYKGDPDEFIQEAAFGDIVMSLPQTEFVGYSRQLFGIKMDTKYKNLRTKAFFSRTKGLSEVKRFTGNTQFQRVTIPDTSYIPLKYYSLKSGIDGAKIGTVKIYQADLKISNSSNIIITTTTIMDSLLSPTSTYSGNFYLLVPGQDYIVDYRSGIVSFRNPLGSNYMIAVDYQKADGTWLRDTGSQPGQPKIVKDQNNTVGITTELKTFYSLGNVKIIRDNGRGNFILQIKDLSNNIPSSIEPGGKPVPIYPPQVGVPINMNADFDNGIVYFDPADSKPFPDDLYTINNHRYNIYCEYRYRIKIISLRPGIVPQSEKVVMDGRVLKNNQDYFIDYDAGLVTFYDVDKITDDTVIDISYDYAPFGSSGGSTLIGLRSELSLTQNVFIGTSFIYDFTSQTQSVPDIRNTPSSLMVAEVDSRLSDMKIPYTPLKMSVSGEYALSVQNPNIMDKAVIESMEGIQQADSVSFFQEAWLPSASPLKVPFYLGDISVSRQEVYKRDISSNLENIADEKQQILNIDYNLTRQNELSLVQAISKEGLDYSKKLYIETWIKGDGKGENLSIEYGTFNEDVDSLGSLRTEDKNNSGTLDLGEDIGWQFRNPDATYSLYGANNGRLDTEDFNANGILDTLDVSAFPGPYGPTDGKTITDVNGVAHANVDWTGWKLFRIPLNIAFPQDWKNIRQVRVTIKGTSNESGTISLAELSIVGNRWESLATEVSGSSITISAINTDDPNYVSLVSNYDYQQLYDSANSSEDLKRKEQALSISYNISAASATELGAKEIYTGRPYDFSAYRYLKFFVYSKGATGDVFFIRACGNDSNYYEYSVPITSDWANNWHRIIIRQDGAAGRADHWVSMDSNGAIASVGSPSLNNINQIKVGVRTTGPKSGEIWVNDIFVTDSFKKEGQARKVNIDLTLPGSKKIGQMTVGGGRKEIERNFQTFSPGIYDRDYLEDNGRFIFGGVNVSGLNLFPISAQLSRVRTIQPSIVQSQNNLVSILDEGRVITYSGSGQTSMKLGNKLPQFSGTYSRSITDTQQISRLEDRETVSGNMDYSNPLNVFVLPSGISANYSISNSFYKIYPSTKMIDSDTFLDVQT
ncbi:MAG: hypothetical protein NT145_07600, partial [Elusimicrobia bacterium]|nr:hypothetical protein [Elusimicrobiota bacterium]